ncbi:nucleoside hydrolase [Staphylococcus simulans]|uniref:nucleoside hydrolase n=1 Tax=Staphylococcus simulans TaxID=1286 RepID=UPI000E6A382F|nr:nucleoside hydrolase [Staphylococcus simulans]RIN78196.1 purine nucleosidase [Staphylococcus simulans]
MKQIYFNHDGGVDDLVSLFLLLQMEDVELIGVSAIGADSYVEPAVSASIKIINRFSDRDLKVAASSQRGKNPFPKEWRMHAFFVDALPVLNESRIEQRASQSELEAYEDIIEKLEASTKPVTLLFTGPLTDLAKALEVAPHITEKIECLVWMGGTFLTKGNVEEPEHDGTAEWNAFWDPEAVATVFDTDIEIDMVELESTNKVPLTIDVRQMWADQRDILGVDFLGVCYAGVPPLTHFVTNSTYFLWDVLTTASVGKPELVHVEEVQTEVITKGPSQGRTKRVTEGGRTIQLVDDVHRDDFFDYMTNLAAKVRV